MRFLHTADWHIGRTIRGRSRESEHHAALRQVLAHAKEQRIDALLVAGDLFDTASPAPESERLLFDFFHELIDLGIPAVVIAGNHDHPRRFDALAPILGALRLHFRGQPVAAQHGGIVEVESQDGREQAVVATLPWFQERYSVDFVDLSQEVAASYRHYEGQVQLGMETLARAFRPDAVSVLVAHLLVNGAKVGAGGGERPLQMTWGIYGVGPEKIPPAQYVALGHVHKPQTVRSSPGRACYPGSLLQLDFGEREQDKFVNLVEVHAGLPAEVVQLPITAGRQLIDIGSPFAGARLDELSVHAEAAGDAWLRVFVDVEGPVGNLAAQVREPLPNAVSVERSHSGREATSPSPALAGLSPEELFKIYYRSPQGRGLDPSDPTLELFRRLLEEESRASAEA